MDLLRAHDITLTWQISLAPSPQAVLQKEMPLLLDELRTHTRTLCTYNTGGICRELQTAGIKPTDQPLRLLCRHGVRSNACCCSKRSVHRAVGSSIWQIA